jgi:membrane associated rhomboid family serine protease
MSGRIDRSGTGFISPHLKTGSPGCAAAVDHRPAPPPLLLRWHNVIPYRDENLTDRPAAITIAIIAACVLVWIIVQGAGATMSVARSICNLGLIPGELTMTLPAGSVFPMGDRLACVSETGPHLSHIVTHMFLHGSWMHLIGNMWFLWLFGDNVEDAMTRPRYLAFYLICGLAAAGLQVFFDPSSGIPMVGASGAISGVMGGYLVLFPRVRVFTLVPFGFFLSTIALPAWVMLLYWIGLQLVGGLGTLGAEGGGVAFWAHVGGFATGILLVRLFARSNRTPPLRARPWTNTRAGWS